MMLTDDDRTDLKNRFSCHAPHGTIRTIMYCAAMTVIERTPPGREQALALTKLEEAMMWANAAIARKGPLTENLAS